MQNKTILLVGCGKMGSAMLAGWLAQGVDKKNVTVVEPNAEYGTSLQDKFGVNIVNDVAGFKGAASVDIIVLAVKPQTMADILPSYKAMNPKALFLSIAAGKTISYFEKHLGADRAIIRTMPNLPATISKGVTVACANGHVSAEQKENAGALLKAVGQYFWVEDESLLDAVTAISGSGPAYLFYFLECFVKSAEALGLPEELALPLVYQTVSGSIELALESDNPASTLREQVTSKGGTTEAALKVLMANGLESLMMNATQAAQERSVELAD